MKLLMVAFLIASLLLPTMVSADPVPCVMGEWYADYNTLVGLARENLIAAEDTAEVLADKTLNLYAVQFRLEVLLDAAPTCAKGIVRKTVYLVSLEADLAMLVVLQSSGLNLADTDIALLINQYNAMISGAVSGVQSASENVILVESIQ